MTALGTLAGVNLPPSGGVGEGAKPMKTPCRKKLARAQAAERTAWAAYSAASKRAETEEIEARASGGSWRAARAARAAARRADKRVDRATKTVERLLDICE